MSIVAYNQQWRWKTKGKNSYLNFFLEIDQIEGVRMRGAWILLFSLIYCANACILNPHMAIDGIAKSRNPFFGHFLFLGFCFVVNSIPCYNYARTQRRSTSWVFNCINPNPIDQIASKFLNKVGIIYVIVDTWYSTSVSTNQYVSMAIT